MSFLIDPPLLFLFGVFIYLAGKKLEWHRHAKIVVGIGIVLVFIVFSTLLYMDVFRCVFPFVCNGLTGSAFMFHTNYTGISKDEVPIIVVVLLFLLYPIWLFAGYALTYLHFKRKLYSNGLYSYEHVTSKKSRDSSKYAVVRNPEPKKALREALSSLGGIESFVEDGNKVLIKANICGGIPEIEGTFTGINVMEEFIELVQSVGGKPFIVDADMIWTKFWPAATDEGWVKWAKDKGATLVNLSETNIVNFDFGDDSVLGIEKVSKEMLDADVIVSFAVMKTHNLTGVTLGMKNMYGTFPEIDKAKYHKMKIEDVIYGVNKAFTPNLTIIDGTIGGETAGPLSCEPVHFQTIVASNDVVTADAIACQLMGYDPIEDITHIRMGHEKGLGDASQKYDFTELPYTHPKDGNWEGPSPESKEFYEWGIEFILNFPGWATLFNLGSDFFMYDLSRLPILKHFNHGLIRILNEVSHMMLRRDKSKEAKKRRKVNFFITLVISIVALAAFYIDGFFMQSSLFFKLNLFIVIVISMLIATRMKTIHLVGLVISSAIVAAVVEYVNPTSGILTYHGGATPPLFAVLGWVLMMIPIAGFSILLCKWIQKLGLFQNVGDGIIQRNLPILATLIIFTLFLKWDGYFEVADMSVAVMYAVMALIGLVYTNRHSIELNASLMIVSIAIGGYMELIGSQAGLWQYHYMEPLPVFIVITWALNTWAIHGLLGLVNIDVLQSRIVEGEENRC